MNARHALALAMVAACGHAIDDHALVDVKRDDLIVGIDVSGELAAVDSTDVKPPSLPGGGGGDFKISMLAPEGTDIAVGEPLVAFDPSTMTRNLEDMRNEAAGAEKALAKRRDDAALTRRDDELAITQAEADLKKAQLKVEGPEDLVASIQRKELVLAAEQAQLTLDNARAKAASTKQADEEELRELASKAAFAKQRAATLEANVARMEIKAPRAGTVVYPRSWNGDKVKVGDQVWSMMTAVQVVGLGKMDGEGEVDEIDLARVAEHQAVTIRLDALPDAQLHGTVESIAKSVDERSRADPSKVAHLKIALEPTKLAVRPGMRFRGTIEVEKLPAVVQVPADAVFVTADGPVAYRARGGGLERVPIVVGHRTAQVIEVTSGLAPGDRVSRIAPEGS